MMILNFSEAAAPRCRGFGLVIAIALTLAGCGQSDEKETRGDDSETQYWISGMHPWIVQPEPGQCPICGMDLVPLDPDKFSGEIAINPVVVQNMGVRIAEVAEGPLTKTIRTVGIVEYDEERVRDVNTKISGWIEEISVDSLGQKVAKGDPLFSIYSPELYSAQRDYLIARQGGDRSLVEAARKRMEFFDVSAAQIDDLAKRGEAKKGVEVASPFGGVVTEKHANEGMKVDPGMRVYQIADLSKVWVIATVYEYQLPFLEEGQAAKMSLSYIPGHEFEGRVAYVYPYVDTKTREAQVRLEFDNAAGILKPGMFANVELISWMAAEATLAPQSAVIDTGKRKVAFVSLGEGRFEPRDVETGLVTDDAKVEIISGLEPGEMVVTSGQFLLDSEANMREALAKMLKGEPAAGQEPVMEVETMEPTGEPVPVDALEAYLSIQRALAGDSLEGVAEAARTFGAAVGGESGEVESLISATDLTAARAAFGRLSVEFRARVVAGGVPDGFDGDVLSMHCPMFTEDQGGAVWLQAAGAVENPYMGSRMLGCFDARVVLEKR